MKSVVLASTMTALVAAQVIPPPPPGQNANIGINPNPNRAFDPATDPGTMGPFTVSTAPLPQATGGPGSVDPATAQALQLAARNWMADTTIVSNFQNMAKGVTDDIQLKKIADGAFKAEVDELLNKQVMDNVFGNDPRVSIANQTLTNGVFQMVVNNLQIMSFQGGAKINLVDTINQFRCTQILTSIDMYMIAAAELIGDTGFQSRAARPDACAGVLAQNQNDATQIAPLPGTPFGNPQGTGDGNVPGLPGLAITAGGPNNQAVANVQAGSAGANATANAASGNANAGLGSNGSAANGALPNATTPQNGLPGFPNQGPGGSPQTLPDGQAQNGNINGSVPPGVGNNTNSAGTGNQNPNQAAGSGAANQNPNQNPNQAGAANQNPNQNPNQAGAANQNPNQNPNQAGAANQNPNQNPNQAGAANQNPNQNPNQAGAANQNPNQNPNQAGGGVANQNPNQAGAGNGVANQNPNQAGADQNGKGNGGANGANGANAGNGAANGADANGAQGQGNARGGNDNGANGAQGGADGAANANGADAGGADAGNDGGKGNGATAGDGAGGGLQALAGQLLDNLQGGGGAKGNFVLHPRQFRA